MLFTRRGDNGTSGLFGTSQRFTKCSPIYDALGTLDELNSLIGLCRTSCHGTVGAVPAGILAEVLPELLKVQERLFVIQAELAGASKAITQNEVDELESTIGYIEQIIHQTHSFIVPGATSIAAWCDFIRSVSRRAERTVIAAQTVRALSAPTMAYLNRLSSLLYALARYSVFLERVEEFPPTYAS